MWTDLTLPMSEKLPAWPGETGISYLSKISGDSTSSHISLNVHTGTHIDAPLHHIPGGKSVDDIDINDLTGTVQIIDVGNSNFVDIRHLNNLKSNIVFFKTKNQFEPKFNPNYCYISPDTAQFLVNNQVKIVGIDYLSVENFNNPNFPTHKILLRSNTIIVESIDLSNINEGMYEVLIVPIRLLSEASPARVLIRPLK